MDPPESGFPWEAVVGLLPHVLWAAVVVAIFVWIGPEAIRSALRRLSKVGVAGVELEFRDELEAAVEAREKPSTPEDVARASRRLAASAPLVRGSRILWVDDQPENNHLDVRLLRSAGAKVTLAESTAEAFREMGRAHFDIVISDISRGDDPTAGLRMAEIFPARGVSSPLIFYVGEARKPIPDGAFGVTDRPDELLHLILDALARLRS